MSPNYLSLQDEDAVMLIQLVFMLKGLQERDVKMGIPAAPNNQPISVVANLMELMLSFDVRYVNWILNHQDSPPRKHTLVQNSQDSPP
uniref:Uncharacterized protein n=1 Tax=Lactuca sativa TaxID=4236 RepID=A0A9R1UC71_LACSA|nr:hypothetical protein LSAT_V11C900499570 [Lactuca sativa]